MGDDRGWNAIGGAAVTVTELITELKKFPPNAEVLTFDYDGDPRTAGRPYDPYDRQNALLYWDDDLNRHWVDEPGQAVML